jgi:hypothetical protein
MVSVTVESHPRDTLEEAQELISELTDDIVAKKFMSPTASHGFPGMFWLNVTMAHQNDTH